MIAADDNAVPLDVLLVENSPGDVRLTQEAFGQGTRNVRLHVVTDGLEAMEFLTREGIHAYAPRPDLVLLDLNMPGLSGRDVLAQIKVKEDLKAIPIVVLTTSDNEADILICYQLQANCYLRKPAHWDAFDNLVKSINAFWLTRAKLPRQIR